MQSVSDHGGRVAVRCTEPVTLSNDAQVRWVAISDNDAAKAARFVSLALAAKLSGGRFLFNVPIDATTNTPGCLAKNCRTPTHFGFE